MKDAKKFCEMCEAAADIFDKECWNCGNTVFNDSAPVEPNNDEIRRAAETLRNAPVPTEGRSLLNPPQESGIDEILEQFLSTAWRKWEDGILDKEALANAAQGLLQLFEKEAVDVERWVGGNQSTGHAEAFKAVPIDKLRELLGGAGV